MEYLSGAMTNTEGGFENLEIMVHRPAAGAAAPFDWSVDVRALDGGLVETKDRLASQAPPDGYKPSASYVVAAADPHWSRRLVRRFYSRNHGYEIQSMIYAWVELEVTLDETSADPTVKVHYVANFGNSRDLVPGPTKSAVK